MIGKRIIITLIGIALLVSVSGYIVGSLKSKQDMRSLQAELSF